MLNWTFDYYFNLFIYYAGQFSFLTANKLDFQIAKSNVLCMFNDYLPVDEELRRHAKPTRYVS
jgi:hypothetical protein